MALTDIVFGQENSNVADRGNIGSITDNLSNEAISVLLQTGVVQQWNAVTGKWVVVPLRYRTSEGWV